MTTNEIVLITGPQWVPHSYFERYYHSQIVDAANRGARFVVGAAEGVDEMAQALLGTIANTHVTVYNKGTKDGRLIARFELRNGFASYPERDSAMAAVATSVISVLPQMGGGQSGALAPTLAVVARELDADAVLALVRQHSEPYDAVLTAKVRDVYEQHYGTQK